MNTSESIFPMNDQHRATDSEWYYLEARTCGDKADVVAYSTIRELRDRIEALEAAQQAQADASHVIDPEREKTTQELIQSAVFAMPPWNEFEACAASVEASKDAKPAEQQTYCLYDKSADSPPQPNHPEIPGGSLVDRVANAMDGATEWQARRAIREVAAWMREQKPCGIAVWAQMLEGEAER